MKAKDQKNQQLSSNPADYSNMTADEAIELLGQKKDEPKVGSKEWFEGQIWTKPFRKFWGLKLTPIRRDKRKIGRNEMCECGSGVKYKKCCGK